ncbi:hypothetical protein ACFL1T_01870 [Chlamydiota bacterium]
MNIVAIYGSIVIILAYGLLVFLVIKSNKIIRRLMERKNKTLRTIVKDSLQERLEKDV